MARWYGGCDRSNIAEDRRCQGFMVRQRWSVAMEALLGD